MVINNDCYNPSLPIAIYNSKKHKEIKFFNLNSLCSTLYVL